MATEVCAPINGTGWKIDQARAALAILFTLVGANCRKAGPSPTDAARAAPAGAPEGEAPRAADTVTPAYPVEHLPDDPAAHQLCEAIHGLVAARRQACCGHKGGLVLTGECARLVSTALRLKSIRIDPE